MNVLDFQDYRIQYTLTGKNLDITLEYLWFDHTGGARYTKLWIYYNGTEHRYAQPERKLTFSGAAYFYSSLNPKHDKMVDKIRIWANNLHESIDLEDYLESVA